MNLELYRKAVTSKDRVFTGKCDINGRKINVGDVEELIYWQSGGELWQD